jgi:hypothetical protein
MAGPVYSEEIPLTQWATVMIGIFVTILTPTVLIEAIGVHEEPSLLWFYIIMDLFFVVIMLNFRKIRVTIDSTSLVVSFGLLRKKIPPEDISRCEKINASLSEFTGMGIRYGGDGSLAYLPRLGEAVKVIPVSGRSFVFSTNNSEKVLDILGSCR